MGIVQKDPPRFRNDRHGRFGSSCALSFQKDSGRPALLARVRLRWSRCHFLEFRDPRIDEMIFALLRWLLPVAPDYVFFREMVCPRIKGFGCSYVQCSCEVENNARNSAETRCGCRVTALTGHQSVLARASSFRSVLRRMETWRSKARPESSPTRVSIINSSPKRAGAL